MRRIGLAMRFEGWKDRKAKGVRKRMVLPTREGCVVKRCCNPSLVSLFFLFISISHVGIVAGPQRRSAWDKGVFFRHSLVHLECPFNANGATASQCQDCRERERRGAPFPPSHIEGVSAAAGTAAAAGRRFAPPAMAVNNGCNGASAV